MERDEKRSIKLLIVLLNVFLNKRQFDYNIGLRTYSLRFSFNGNPIDCNSILDEVTHKIAFKRYIYFLKWQG